jgi:hypothetical protein
LSSPLTGSEERLRPRRCDRLIDDSAVAQEDDAVGPGGQLRSWVTTTPATSRFVAARSRRITDSPFTESSAPVGSSASSNPRSPTIARAIAIRWRSPPDSSSA